MAEAYQALYRKWRPQVFADVVGQEHVTRTLMNEVRTGERYRQDDLRQDLRESSQL